MTDFYALLKQSILARDIRDADDRQAVYAQARQAIVKQLWAFRPPLAADEIDTRVGAYDEAVERIERDVKATFADAVRARERTSTAARTPPASELMPDMEAAIAAPPLAEWRHDGPDEPIEGHEGGYEEDEYEAGVPRSNFSNGSGAPPAYEQVAYADEPSGDGEEPEPVRWQRDDVDSADVGYDENADTHHERWRDSGIETVRPWWRPNLSERETIQILAGAISALVIAVIALGAYYFFFSRDTEVAATPDISVRREVSDAATAARIPAEALQVVQSYSVFDGRDPTIFATTPDNPVRYVSEGGFARLSSSASAPGVKATIGPGLAGRLAGQRVRVTLVARSSTDFGAATMRFAYQSGLAISHWQTANLSADYEEVGMIWRVPTMRTSPTGDSLLIEPGIPGDGTGVDIQSIKIDVLAGDN